MCVKLSELLVTGPAYRDAPMVNEEGAPAFIRSPEERLIQVLTTGTFENTFYVGAKELATQAIELFKPFAESDPKFLAQAILYARTEGHMRTVPITALVALSTAEDKTFFRALFPQVIQTPGDLADFLTIVRTKRIRGMGKTITHAVQGWLAGISEYHVIKYGSENQAMSLRDMYRIARPTLTGKAAAIAQYVVKGEVSTDLDQIIGYEAFKAAAHEPNSTQTALYFIQQARLPWEVVVAHMSNNQAWTALLKNLPYMALLRNLNNLGKHGVLTSSENTAYVVNVLADPDRVAKSKQFPFRFYAALKTVSLEDHAMEIAQALNTALELSFQNVPGLGDDVLICNDISGSMASPPSPQSDMTMKEIAGIFAAAVFKRTERGEVVSFHTSLVPRHLNRTQPMTLLARQISAGDGGTDLSLPLRYALERGKHYDTIILITDNESWYDHLTHHRGTMDEFRAYRAKNPNVQMFLVQLMPYQDAQVRQDEPGIYYIYGWNGDVLKHIAAIRNGGASQVEYVRNLPLVA